MMPPAIESHVLAGRTVRRSSGDSFVESMAVAGFNDASMRGMHVVHAGGTREAHALSEGVMEIDLFHRVYRTRWKRSIFASLRSLPGSLEVLPDVVGG